MPQLDLLLAAARRLLLLLAAVSAIVVAVGLFFAALGAGSVDRAVSLGFYGVGSFLVLGGFLLGNRGPYRSGRSRRGGLGRELQRSTPDETRDTINMAILLTVLGFVLLAIGVIIDSRFRLV